MVDGRPNGSDERRTFAVVRVDSRLTFRTGTKIGTSGLASCSGAAVEGLLKLRKMSSRGFASSADRQSSVHIRYDNNNNNNDNEISIVSIHFCLQQPSNAFAAQGMCANFVSKHYPDPALP